MKARTLRIAGGLIVVGLTSAGVLMLVQVTGAPHSTPRREPAVPQQLAAAPAQSAERSAAPAAARSVEGLSDPPRPTDHADAAPDVNPNAPRKVNYAELQNNIERMTTALEAFNAKLRRAVAGHDDDESAGGEADGDAPAEAREEASADAADPSAPRGSDAPIPSPR